MMTPPPVNAFLAWQSLGLQWLEMMAASGQVFSRRARRDNTPAQWIAMGGEKMLASLESSQAMARRMAVFPTGSALSMWDAWARVLASGVAPYRTRALRNARAGRRRRR